LENFSSFGFVKGGLVCRTKPNVLKCAAGKKKLKMRVGKNFKNIRVGLRVGLSYRVRLLKNVFKSVRLNCQVAKSPFFSRHFQDCTVFLRLGITGRYCRWWDIRIPSAGTAAWLFDKVKY